MAIKYRHNLSIEWEELDGGEELIVKRVSKSTPVFTFKCENFVVGANVHTYTHKRRK